MTMLYAGILGEQWKYGWTNTKMFSMKIICFQGMFLMESE